MLKAALALLLCAGVLSGCVARQYVTATPAGPTATMVPRVCWPASQTADAMTPVALDATLPRHTAAVPSRLVGFWLRGVHVWHDPDVPEAEVVGFVMSAPGTPLDDVGELTGLLASGEIVATFRSARELKLVIEPRVTTPGVGRSNGVDWYCATYADGWTFQRASPPEIDQFYSGSSMHPCYEGDGVENIGPAEAGLLDGATIVHLPSPLRERGISVWRAPSGKGRAIRTTRPKDASLTILLTAEEHAAALRRLKDVSLSGHRPWLP